MSIEESKIYKALANPDTISTTLRYLIPLTVGPTVGAISAPKGQKWEGTKIGLSKGIGTALGAGLGGYIAAAPTAAIASLLTDDQEKINKAVQISRIIGSLPGAYLGYKRHNKAIGTFLGTMAGGLTGFIPSVLIASAIAKDEEQRNRIAKIGLILGGLTGAYVGHKLSKPEEEEERENI